MPRRCIYCSRHFQVSSVTVRTPGSCKWCPKTKPKIISFNCKIMNFYFVRITMIPVKKFVLCKPKWETNTIQWPDKNVQQVTWVCIVPVITNTNLILYTKKKLPLYFKQVSSQEGAWRCGGKTARIPNLATGAGLVVSYTVETTLSLPRVTTGYENRWISPAVWTQWWRERSVSQLRTEPR
jgi:hypothetical protein